MVPATEERSDGAGAQRGREAFDVRVQLPREADQAGQHQSLVPSARALWHPIFPLARSSARMDNLARTERHAAVRVAGIGRLEKSGDCNTRRVSRAAVHSLERARRRQEKLRNSYAAAPRRLTRGLEFITRFVQP